MSSTGSAAGPPRDWPAVDGRFRYVERRSTAVRKGRAGRSSDLVRAKPRPTRKTFRDVEQAPSFHRETAIPGAGFRFDSSVLARSVQLSKNSACLPPPPLRRILFVEINKKKNLLSSLFLPRKETLFSIIDKPIEGKRMKMESNVTFDCRPRTKANRISSMIQLDGTIGAFTKRIISGRAGARLTRSQSTSSKRATSGARAT